MWQKVNTVRGDERSRRSIGRLTPAQADGIDAEMPIRSGEVSSTAGRCAPGHGVQICYNHMAAYPQSESISSH